MHLLTLMAWGFCWYSQLYRGPWTEGSRQSFPLAQWHHTFAEGALTVQVADDIEQHVSQYQSLEYSSITDTRIYSVRLHCGNPRQDPKPSEANENIFNDSANGPIVGVPRYD